MTAVEAMKVVGKAHRVVEWGRQNGEYLWYDGTDGADAG